MTATIDTTTESGARAAQRLREEPVIWLTTVSPGGRPQTSPVWFWWDGDRFWVWSLESARVKNIAANPHVSLNLDGNGRGGDVVSVEGDARVDRSLPAARDVPEYVAKYERMLAGYGWTWDSFCSEYPVPITVEPTRYRVW